MIVIYSILKPFENHLVYNVAYQSYLLLKIFTDTSYSGNHIYLNRFDIEIVAPCTGIIFISLYLALLLSLSKDIREVIAGVPLLVIIYLGNILRIFLTGFFGEIFTEKVQWVHEVVGYLILPIFSVIATLMYLKILSRMRSK